MAAISEGMTRLEFDEQYARGLNCLLHAEFAEALSVLQPLNQIAVGNPKVPYATALCLTMLNRKEEALVLCGQLNTQLNDPRGEKLAAAIAAFNGNGKTFPVDFLLPEEPQEPSQEDSPVMEVKRAETLPKRAGGHFRRTVFAALAIFFCVLMIGTWKAAYTVAEWRMRNGPAIRFPQLAHIAPRMPQTALLPAAKSAEPSKREASAKENISEPAVTAPESTPPSSVLTSTNGVEKETETVAEPVPPVKLPSLPEGPVDSIIDLQPYRVAEYLTNAGGDWVRLTNLNPLVGAWYLLETHFQNQEMQFHLETFPLENAFGPKPKLALYGDGLAVISEGKAEYFPLWAQGPAAGGEAGKPETSALNPSPGYTETLVNAAKTESALTLLCGDKVLVRTQRPGSSSEMEFAVDVFRRSRVGDWFVEKMKPWLIKAPETAGGEHGTAAPDTRVPVAGFPQDALLDSSRTDLTHNPKLLGVEVETQRPDLVYGRWYRAMNHPGVYVSVMIASAVDTKILESYTDRVSQMGATERKSTEANNLAYFLAFDLEQFAFGFCLGADHPRVDWSARAQGFDKSRGGPDGFGDKKPLATVGIVPPYLERAAAAVFAGGFKREHGAFMYGDFSRVNNGSHFGFVEQGVMFSRLTPGLATIEIDPYGRIDLLTYPEDVNTRFPSVLHARQNGVPLVDGVDADGISIPGAFVSQRGAGSWSGNVKGEQMTIRAGLGLQEMPSGKRFLLLGYFTGATPKSMARVFQAFQCRYAMGLDINSLALCYSALYVRDKEGNITQTEYLVKDMSLANCPNGALRFLQNNDTRDFFYLLRRG